MVHEEDKTGHEYPPELQLITRDTLFAPRLPWFLLFPLFPFLPLIGAVVILTLLIRPESTFSLAFLSGLPDTIFFANPERTLIHLGELLMYIAAAGLHSILCVLAIGYFTYLIYTLPLLLRLRALIFIVLESVLLIFLAWYFREEANDTMLIKLAYKATCSMLSQASLPTGLMDDCFSRGVSTLTMLAWIPTILGIGAVLFAASFAHAAVGGLPRVRSEEWRAAFTARIEAIQRSFYVLSLVLVSSTFTIMLFTHLPSGLLNPEAPGRPGLADAVNTYANGLVLIWGGIFTLTLIATFVPSAGLLIRAAKQHEETREEIHESAAEFRIWLHTQLFVSTKHQLGNVVTMMAPLMIGPIADLLGSLPGS